eukprot:ctg_2260.g741
MCGYSTAMAILHSTCHESRWPFRTTLHARPVCAVLRKLGPTRRRILPQPHGGASRSNAVRRHSTGLSLSGAGEAFHPQLVVSELSLHATRIPSMATPDNEQVILLHASVSFKP